MKTSEARKLIGKEVEWEENICPVRGGFVRRGKIVGVMGKNVLVNFGGSDDWKWLPQMIGLRLKDGQTSGDEKTVA